MNSKQNSIVCAVQSCEFELVEHDAATVIFKAGGLFFRVNVDEDDPMFLCLEAPSCWRAESEEDLGCALEAINATALKRKVVKASMDGGVVSLSAEMLLPEFDDLRRVLPRAVSMVGEAVNLFRAELAVRSVFRGLSDALDRVVLSSRARGSA